MSQYHPQNSITHCSEKEAPMQNIIPLSADLRTKEKVEEPAVTYILYLTTGKGLRKATKSGNKADIGLQK
jgi:hypothetical protein